MKILSLSLVTATALSALSLLGSAIATEVVHFNSAVLPSAAKQESGTAQEEGFPIWGHLSTPKGPGPHPAIVLMHGCGGILQAHFRWASMLNDEGYITLVLDSFRPRSALSVCKSDTRSTGFAQRALDAHGALAYLQTRPDVDQHQVSVIGWSHGATAALEAANERGATARLDSNFAGAIAFYPYCISDRRFALPVLILIGESDDWTPADLCRDLADRNRSYGTNTMVELITYPGAFHSFDKIEVSEGFAIEGPLGTRHWLKYDPDAHRDSVRRVKSFLAEQQAKR